jgi:AraC-like DNA-binding protein
MWQVSGRNRIEHKGSALTVEPGEWTIYDTAQPYSIDTSEGSHFLVLLLPVSQVGPAASGIEFVAGKVLPTRGTAEIARSALAGMLAGGIELEQEGAVVMQDSISALIGAAVSQVYGHTLQEEGAARRKLQKVQAYIESHLTDPALCPESVAQACGMSRRSLYTAFNALQQTPNSYILKRRLAVAAERLVDPSLRNTITQLAFELGFSDAAHFSRVFSERYGMSPSHWRDRRRA